MAIVVPIDADVSGLTRKLGMATSTLGGFGRMAGYVAGAAAFGGLIATVKIGVDEFMQAEKVTAQTNAVLKSTGSVANVTKRQIDQLGTSIMRKSGFDDEAVKSSENLLLTFTKVRNEAGRGNDVFNQATKVTADLSVALGKDLNTSAMMVGKALNDPLKGISALGRAGVQFTADQKEQIKAMVESGNVMGAQKMILKELTTQVGGSAEAFGKTLPGQLNILRETFNNLAGDLVATFMPGIARAAQSIVNFITDLQARPTFTARVEFTIGKIRDLAGNIYNSVLHWWNTSQTKELPAGVVLTPAGRDQVAAWAADLQRKLNSSIEQAGYAVGQTLTAALFSGAKQGARQNGSDTGNSIIRNLFVNTAALDLGKRLALSVYRGMADELAKHSVMELIQAWIDSTGISMPGKFHLGIGEALVENLISQAEKKVKTGAPRLSNTIAKSLSVSMASAVQSARSGLASSASGLGGLLAQIIGDTKSSGLYGNAAAMSSEGRALEDRRASIQEASLRAALAATEAGSAEQVQAQLDLDDFLYNRKAQLRQRDVDDATKSTQKQIDDLAAKFNSGALSAQSFSAQLDAIIGEERGAALGDAFSQGFTNALQSLKNAALDIYNIVGGGKNVLAGSALGPDMGAPGSGNEGPATGAARAQYQQDLADWNELQRLRKAVSKADKDQRAAAVRALNQWKDSHPDYPTKKPVKKDYGLLAAGGLLTGPRYIAGESGNEAVIPLGSPTAVQMMRKAFGESINSGASNTYAITVNAGMGSDGTDIGRQIVEAIKVFERRNGPVFAGA